MNELRQLVDDIGRRSFEARTGRHEMPEPFDNTLWRTLEDTGLARLTSQSGAGPSELAVVLAGLARHAASVPIAETELAAWLAERAEIEVPQAGPLTVAIGFDAAPWAEACAAVLLVTQTGDGLAVRAFTDGHNLDGPPSRLLSLDPSVGTELQRRGAWARCVQIIGALDSAAELTVAHVRQRVQFGRPLSAFQAVQHSLAAMAGEIERARAATDLAIAGADDYGFASPQAEYAVTVAKVAVGRAVPAVTTIAHQLHGAIGVTAEYPLWRATLRAPSWATESGSTGHYARRLGRLALAAENPWDLIVGG